MKKVLVVAWLLALLVPMQASAAPIVINDVFPSGDLVHMWAVTVPNGGGQFSASTAGSGFYTELFLFDWQWKGLQANSITTNSYPDYSSLPPQSLLPGTYYVAVAKAGHEPFSALGKIFPPVTLGVVGPTGPGGSQPLAYWSGGDWASYDLNLTLTLTGVQDAQPVGTVPEPASMTLIGTGLVGLVARRLRRRQA